MSYTMTQWQNGQEPAINAENLNKIERGIYDAHQAAKSKYSKPSLGIPKNDLAESVKNSLDNADSALQNDDVDSALSLISTNPAQNKVITNKIAGTDRRLDILYKLTQGQAWDFDRDDNNAYSVDVPSGAKYVSVDMVGGKSVVFEQRIKPEYIEASKTENGITFTNNGDGTVTVSGTATDNTSFKIGENTTTGTLKNKPFILTGCPKGGSVDTYFIGLANTSDMFKWDKGDGCYKANGYDYGYELSIHIMSGTVIDTPITFKPNLFFINTSDFPSLDIFKQMFPADYYPYCEPTIISSQTDRVDVRGKNLWNDDNTMYNTSVWTRNGSKYISSRTTAGYVYEELLLDVGNYVLSTELVSFSSDAMKMQFRNTNNVVIASKDNIKEIGRHQLTYSITEKGVYRILVGGMSNGSLEFADTMLVKSSVATEYSPYSLQQIQTSFPVLNSAGSVYDYIDLNEGKLHQRVGKAVFDGSESWRVNTSATAFYLEKANLPNKKQGSMLSAMSNRYSYGGTAGASSGTANGSFRFYNNSNPNINDEIYVNDTSLADVAALKASLANNPLTIIYELAEEIVTDIEIPAELADWLTVEAGGSITFHNVDEGKRLLIPSTEEYLVKLSEVISNG